MTYLHDVPATHTNTAFLELVKTQPSRLGARGNKLDRKMTWKHSLTALCIQHVQHSTNVKADTGSQSENFHCIKLMTLLEQNVLNCKFFSIFYL